MTEPVPTQPACPEATDSVGDVSYEGLEIVGDGTPAGQIRALVDTLRQVMAERDREHSSRQEWAAEAMRLDVLVEEQYELNAGWVRYRDRVIAQRGEWRGELASALGIDVADGRLPHMFPAIRKVAELRADLDRTRNELVHAMGGASVNVIPGDAAEQLAKALREHGKTTGMAVTMGWTCRCQHWASGRKGETGQDHQAEELLELVRSWLAPPATDPATAEPTFTLAEMEAAGWEQVATELERDAARSQLQACSKLLQDLEQALAKPSGSLYHKLVDWLDEPLNRTDATSAADTAASAVHWFIRLVGERGYMHTEDDLPAAVPVPVDEPATGATVGQWKNAYEMKLADFARETLRVSRMLQACDRSNVPQHVVGEAGLGYEYAQEVIRKAAAEPATPHSLAERLIAGAVEVNGVPQGPARRDVMVDPSDLEPVVHETTLTTDRGYTTARCSNCGVIAGDHDPEWVQDQVDQHTADSLRPAQVRDEPGLTALRVPVADEAVFLRGLSGVEQFVERAALHCADMDGVQWGQVGNTVHQRYREFVQAVLQVMPMHIAGELYGHLETSAAAPQASSTPTPKET